MNGGAKTGAGVLRLENVEKTFVLHLRGGARLPVVAGVSLGVDAGECVALDGPSGTGKSSILKMIFGNYRVDCGQILLRENGGWTDITTSGPRDILRLRRNVLGYVSQFLRVIPRVSCLDLVAASAREGGMPAPAALERARELLSRLNLPERLWGLPPATFSGGEQQRVNIACGFASYRPVMLLDEPTASLDVANSGAVIDLINECKSRGSAILGIFHDPQIRARAASRIVDVRAFAQGSQQHA